MTRLLVVAGLLILGSACVDLRLRLELARDGGGHLQSSITLGPKTTELVVAGGGQALFNQMVPPAPEIARSELREAGVRRLRVGTELGQQWSGHTELRFDDLAAVDRMIERGAVQAPHFSLAGMSGGTWELRSQPATPGRAMDFDRLPGGPNGMFSELENMGEDRQMALALGLLGELASFRVVIEMEVPGDVVEVSPTEGVEVEGGLVRWTYDMKSLGGPLAEGLKQGFEGGGPPVDGAGLPPMALDGTRVRFMPRRPMPPDAAWPR